MKRGYFDLTPDLLKSLLKLPKGTEIDGAVMVGGVFGSVIRVAVTHPELPESDDLQRLSPQYRVVDGGESVFHSWGI